MSSEPRRAQTPEGVYWEVIRRAVIEVETQHRGAGLLLADDDLVDLVLAALARSAKDPIAMYRAATGGPR
jgi:hypothetical protein